MNDVVSRLRQLCVMIVHAPSDTTKLYKGTLWRQCMQRAPPAPSAMPILNRCPRDPRRDAFPVDDSAGICNDPVVKEWKSDTLWSDYSCEVGLGQVNFRKAREN